MKTDVYRNFIFINLHRRSGSYVAVKDGNICEWIQKMLIFNKPVRLFETVTARVCRLRRSHFSAARATANSCPTNRCPQYAQKAVENIRVRQIDLRKVNTNLFPWPSLAWNVTRLAKGAEPPGAARPTRKMM